MDDGTDLVNGFRIFDGRHRWVQVPTIPARKPRMVDRKVENPVGSWANSLARVSIGIKVGISKTCEIAGIVLEPVVILAR
jgi:hypothetical protein